MLLITVLPCVSFFRVAYEYHGNLFIRRAQLQTVAELESREERIRRNYENVKLTTATGTVDEVARALFLRSRIDDQMLDRYDTVFLSLGEQEYSRRTKNRWIFRVTDQYILRMLANFLRYARAEATRELDYRDAGSALWQWSPRGKQPATTPP